MNLGIKRKTIVLEASAWRRFGAFLVDYIILNAFVLFPFSNLLEKIFKTDSLADIMAIVSGDSMNVPALMYISFFMAVIALLYFAILEWRLNQTIGKIMMKIFVVSIKDKKDAKMSFFQSIVRSLGVLFLFVMPIITIIDSAIIFFNKDRQRFLEKTSKTKTVMATRI